MNNVRVRIAPSPTGYLHIGTLFIALYNYLFAKKHGGKFIVRIEDTDRTRLVADAQAVILSTLSWAGLTVDEGPQSDGTEKGDFGPYIQSERLDTYKEYVEKLLSTGAAYWCDCTSKRLEEMRALQEATKQHLGYDGHCRERNLASGLVVRLKVPKEGSTSFDDMVRGPISILNRDVDDQVLMKSDGFPTYHLAVVVDDHLMGISHVIRGEEWISSTPKHVLLYQAFGWEAPRFAHLPLLLGSDRKKLSKRKGDVSVQQYIDKGYLPEALLNFLAMQGWNPSADREKYTIAELIDLFDIHAVNVSGSIVNFEKLDWLNGQYIKELSVGALKQRLQPYTKLTMDERLFTAACEMLKDRLVTLSDFDETARFLIELPEYDVSKVVWKKSTAEQTQEVLKDLRELLAMQEDFSLVGLESIVEAYKEKTGKGNGDVLWSLRYALSGLDQSPPPLAIAVVLEKSEVLRRLDVVLDKFTARS